MDPPYSNTERSHRAYPAGNSARWWRCRCGYSRYVWGFGKSTRPGFRASRLALHLQKKGENNMRDSSDVWTGKASSYNRVRPTPPPALLALLTQLIGMPHPALVVDVGS